MSESILKSSQPLPSKQEKDGTEKRSWGRPRKQPLKEPSKVPKPKRPQGRSNGRKNKDAAKTWKTTTTPGRKPRGPPWAEWGAVFPWPQFPASPAHPRIHMCPPGQG
uniref:HMGA1 n=1 Tax=Pongo abelii TaxID=9601 RepID=H2N9Y2_PONAB